MDLNQVLSKDLFFLTYAQKNPKKSSKIKSFGAVYKQSHSHYLERLRNKPTVILEEHLPIATQYGEIKQLILKHQVVIICGETGSGKTTQIPKICLELNRGIAGMIAHSQPRRIAARAVASRIAEELNCQLGHEVGYKVRFQDKTSSQTYIKIMTDGMLLSEIQSDRYLYAYDTIIIDEAHERSLNIDFLLGCLKKIASRRKDLKIIITSATINAQIFSDYFDKAPIINVAGRTFPVEVRYQTATIDDDNETAISLPEAVLSAVNDLWRQALGDILVFLPGEREIRECSEWLRKNLNNAEILPLFARLSVQAQQKIFKPKVLGNRIILATNIAETSLTVPGIKYVIDSGLARIKRYTPRLKVEQLNIEKISQSSAKQRMGRCGRTSEGICIRLYSEQDYLTRSEFTDPEIIRSNLAHVILMMAYLKLGDIHSFSFIDSPDKRLINNAMQWLTELGAMNQQAELTKLGKEMAKIPLDPKFSRILLAGKQYDCIDEILIIISALSMQDPRERPFEAREAAQQAHKKFADAHSDFLGFIHLWNFWKSVCQKSPSKKVLLAKCKEHFLSFTRMKEWQDILQQLEEAVTPMGCEVNFNREIAIPTDKKSYRAFYESIHRALLSGLLANIGMKSLERGDYQSVRGGKFHIFPASYVFSKKPLWLMASELIETSKLYAHHVAWIEPEWVEQAAPHLIKYHYTEPRWSSKRQEVIANQRASLYALTIIAKRVVSLGHIQPVIARDIFIREGLIPGEVRLSESFYLNNSATIKAIHEIEHRERKKDFLLEEVLYSFYNEKLPDTVFSVSSLLSWLKQDKIAHNQSLSIDLEDLISQSKQYDTQVQFPKYLILSNTCLELSYRFELHHPLDGVTVKVPLALLNTIESARLEWLVPGMIREKITYLIKALPKDIRNICKPFSVFITEFLSSEPDEFQAIIPQLVQAINKRVGHTHWLKNSAFELWQQHQLPDHCYMNIKVVDEDNNEVAMDRDLASLQQLLAKQVQSAFRSQHQSESFEQHKLNHWSIGDISKPISSGNTKGYLGLSLATDGSISLRIFDSREAADNAHCEGVIGLMKLHFKAQIKSLDKGVLNFSQIMLCLHDIYQIDELKQEVTDTICEHAFLVKDNLPKDETSFKHQLDIAKERLPEIKLFISELLLEVSRSYYELKQMIKGHVLESIIKKQLSRLIYSGFVLKTPWTIWPRLPVYLKAIKLRIEKYTSYPKRDQNYQSQIEALEANIAIWLAAEPKQKPPQGIIQYRWKLEELRISLFAQELKTPYSVSVKRLQKEWEVLETSILNGTAN